MRARKTFGEALRPSGRVRLGYRPMGPKNTMYQCFKKCVCMYHDFRISLQNLKKLYTLDVLPSSFLFLYEYRPVRPWEHDMTPYAMLKHAV